MHRVLIDFSHGLGDAVQLTAVLQHLQRYRPGWELYLLAKRGKHSVGHGFCKQVWHDQEPGPDKAAFHHVFALGWYENYNAYPDVPSTKVTNCLREVFGIDPNPELLRYRLHLSDEACRITAVYLQNIGAAKRADGRYNAVCIHYEGNTSSAKKNVDRGTIAAACALLIELGHVPIILDGDRRSPLPDPRRIFNPGVHPDDLWGGFGTGDAERITALIAQCALFIGIDSGPQKCAGATDTPSVGLWTGHLPVQFIDLCPNFSHLVPANFLAIPPCNNPPVAAYFTNHYRYVTYRDLSRSLGDLIPALLGCLLAREKSCATCHRPRTAGSIFRPAGRDYESSCVPFPSTLNVPT